MTEFLGLKNIHKSFSGVHALNDMSLSIQPGEIHCLAGENGSGKSTLIKVISGVYTPDSGTISISGEVFHKLTPIQSLSRGIQVIYQDFSLFGNLTVAENLALNAQLHDNRIFVNWRETYAIAAKALDQLHIDLDLHALVDDLPVSGKQLVAIAKALMFDARLIIMDEPTTALTGKEVANLFDIVRHIQKQGISILFVSHKMREMLEISERLTIIRNGAKVADGPTSDFTEAAITTAMTGQNVRSSQFVFTPDISETPRLQVNGLTIPNECDNLDLTLYKGEIVGITGLLGSGRTPLAKALFGMTKHSGKILVDGKTVALESVRSAIDNGIAYVPEDRLSEGLFASQSINRNLLAAAYDRIAGLFGVVDRNKGSRLTEDLIHNLKIATPSGNNPVNSLSGGNQQRVVLGRWLLTDAKVLILNGPTVGVDVGSKAEIHAMVRTLAEQNGLSVLMISDDVPELIQNCNRILIIHRGQFVREIQASEADEDKINELLKNLD